MNLKKSSPPEEMATEESTLESVSIACFRLALSPWMVSPEGIKRLKKKLLRGLQFLQTSSWEYKIKRKEAGKPYDKVNLRAEYILTACRFINLQILTLERSRDFTNEAKNIPYSYFTVQKGLSQRWYLAQSQLGNWDTQTRMLECELFVLSITTYFVTGCSAANHPGICK